MSVSDKELVAKARNGSAMAFDDLIFRHQERVFALAYHILGNAEDAADIQQETFVIAWRKLHSFRDQASFGTWLHKIAVNQCLSHRRKKSSMHCEELDEARQCSISGNTSDKLIDAIVVRQLLADIPERQRIILILREVDGISIEQIAQIMDSSYRAVVQQLWRVRKLFREKVRRHLWGK